MPRLPPIPDHAFFEQTKLQCLLDNNLLQLLRLSPQILAARWKSRRRSGRPAVSAEIRQLIREMSIANPLWEAPRIHDELLKLGVDVGQTSVAKYMART